MPSERYIAPSPEKIRQWEKEREASLRFNGLRDGLIESALRKLKKDELIDLLMSLYTYDPAPRWSIEAEIDVKKPPDLIAYDLRQAIGIATKVDETKLNRNFDYSWQAYEATEHGFNLLIRAGDLTTAKLIAIEFINKASYQVECSDEGLMTEEIESCLKPLFEAVTAEKWEDRQSWAIAMTQADRCGHICRDAIESLLKSKCSDETQ